MFPVPASNNYQIIVPPNADKDARSRLGQFADWLQINGYSWVNPDLATYRDYLLQQRELSPATVRAHLSTIRARYAALIRNRDLLYALTLDDASILERKAFVDELTLRIEAAIHPDHSAVKVIKRQDRPDDDTIRLNDVQVAELLQAPGMDTLSGLRDTAIIALMVCTGLREAELVNLNVPDLSRQFGGVPALHIREGKGAKERLVPYGDLDWGKQIALRWLSAAGIETGAVFRGFYKGKKRLRSTQLTTRAVQQILAMYPIAVRSAIYTVRPHDLRRTYARQLYESGVDLIAIQQNLGHADTRTTLHYIGTLDAEKRQPPAVYPSAVERWRLSVLED